MRSSTPAPVADSPQWNSARTLIESAWDDPELRKEADTKAAIEAALEALDQGVLRCAEPSGADWVVNEWVKKAVVMYFPMRQMKVEEVGPFQFHDKMALKKNHAEAGVRVVPHAIARYGAFLGKGVVMMPSYVNIGAWVGPGTMVDTWATVGSSQWKKY